MDMVRIWLQSTNANFDVIYKTWLTKFICDEDEDFYHTDRVNNGGEVTYIREKMTVYISKMEFWHVLRT